MRYSFLANWYVAISCAALILTIAGYVITRVWETYKLRSDGQRAIERMRNLGPGEPLEPELAVKPELPLQVGTKVQAVGNVAPPPEPELAVKPALPLQVGTKVQPVGNVAPPPEPALTVKPELPPQVETKVQPVGNVAPPLEPALAVKPGLPPQVGTKVQPVGNVAPPPEPALTVKPALPPQVETKVQAVRNLAPPLQPELAMKPGLPLQVGTKVRAVRNFGPVKDGTPGIITGVADISFFWGSRPAYLCTFADNMKVHARPKEIEAFNHGHSLEELEQPDFGSILSRHMAWRTQQLLSRQRPSDAPAFRGHSGHAERVLANLKT
jgi:hypothetical protein